MEKMLVCDALDERDFLSKKINEAIRDFNPCTTKRKMDKTISTGETVDEFEDAARKKYQSITDMIARKDNINKALILSNATTKIKIKTTGEEITVAEAIAMKKNFAGDDLSSYLFRRMESTLSDAMQNFAILQRKKDSMDENYKNTLAGRDSKILSEEEIASVEKLTDGYSAEMIDPLDIKKLIEDLTDKYTSIRKDIDTGLKVSNATTYIEF